MKSSIVGNLSAKDKELVGKLKEAEEYIDKLLLVPVARKGQTTKTLSSKDIKALGAKSYVCLSHDYFDLEIEEEGERLLLKANKLYPNYFSKILPTHMKEDKDYNTLIVQIAGKIMSIYGDTIK